MTPIKTIVVNVLKVLLKNALKQGDSAAVQEIREILFKLESNERKLK